MSSMLNPLLTIGHSNHPIETFLALLANHRVEAVVDTRSHPRSQYSPHYNQETLRHTLQEKGIQYLYMGKELGGRPAGGEFYDTDGRVF